MNDRTTKGRYEGDGSGSLEEIERDLDRTRAELNDTLDALSRQLSPGQLVDQALDYFQMGPKEYALNLGAQIRDNPLPATLVGIGIGWLMIGSRHPSRHGYRGFGAEDYTSEGISETSYNVAHKGRRAYGSAAESVREMSERVSEKTAEVKARIGHRMDETREDAAKASESVKRGVHSISAGMHRSGETARDTFTRMLNEEPMAVGMIGVAVGALLAAALPTSRRERETLGPRRDHMMDRIRETAHDQMEKAREDLRETMH